MTQELARNLTDDQMRERTAELLRTAQEVSLQLQLQTERLDAAITLFNQTVYGERLTHGDGTTRT